MVSTTAILVQHGEKERTPGNPGLTPLGREQAAAAAAALPPVEAIYASPLRRAAETAGVIADRLSLDVHYDERLRERLNWDGGEISAFLADWEQTTLDRDFVPLSGDSSHRAARRFLEALEDVAAEHATVAVVTHGGVTVDVLRTLAGDGAVPAALLVDGVPPGALTVLERHDGGWEVRRWPA